MLIIRGIEVTQGIQYFRADQHLTDPADIGSDNSLALVANKPAWARVYVETDTPGDLPGVTGSLFVAYGILNLHSGSVSLAPQPPGTVTARFNPSYVTTRSNTAFTLNFVIPADRMCGPIDVTANVRSADGTLTASYTVFIDASLLQTLKLRGIMVGYNGPNPANPAQNLNVAAPTLTDLQNTAAWALRVMPVQSNAVFEVASTLTRNAALTGTATNGSCTAAWVSLNSDIAAAKVADGNHPGYLYYGLIAATYPNTSNVGGCESSGVSAGPAGSQIAFTHEVGHACGRAHAPCGSVGTSADANYPAYEPYDSPAARVASIGEFGLDITSGIVPTPTTARDYMSYCGPAWISIYGHQALTNNDALNPEQTCQYDAWWKHYVAYDPWWWLHYIPDPPPYWIDPQEIRELPSRMQKVISVIGILHADDRVEVTHVTRSEVADTEVKGHATGMTVELLGPKGAKLATARLIETPSRGECGCGNDGEPVRPSMVQAFLPDVAVGSALTISRERRTIWKRTAPRGTLTVSTPRLRVDDRGVLNVAWSVRWPTPAVKDAWLRVSRDDGRTWRSVATNLAEAKASVELQHLPMGKVLLAVVVHDGFRSVMSKPVAFENARRAPVPAILHPQQNVPIAARGTLFLWASVALQSGDSHERWRYAWNLDGKPAGEGLQVTTVAPSEGKHRVVFTVADAQGTVVRKSEIDFSCVATARPGG